MEICGNQVIVFGGFNSTYFNCMYYLNVPVILYLRYSYNVYLFKEEAPYKIKAEKGDYLQKIWRKKKMIDVTFLVEGKKIRAHKIVLYLTDSGFKHILPRELDKVLYHKKNPKFIQL